MAADNAVYQKVKEALDQMETELADASRLGTVVGAMITRLNVLDEKEKPMNEPFPYVWEAPTRNGGIEGI